MSIIYLYVKQCPHCSGLYFGRTEKSNPIYYKGSGKYWKNHLKKHNVNPINIKLWSFDSQDKCTKFALRFSKFYNIVKSKKWFNEKDENGQHNWGPCSHKGKTYEEIYGPNGAEKMLQYKKGKTYEEIYGKEQAIIEKTKRSVAHSGKKKSKEHCESLKAAWAKNPDRMAWNKDISKDDPRYQSLLTKNFSKEARDKISATHKGKTHSEEHRMKNSQAQLGMINAINLEGNVERVTREEYKSRNDLVHPKTAEAKRRKAQARPA